MCNFQKRLVHGIFSKKLRPFLSFVLMKNRSRQRPGEVLERKEAFLDHKHIDLKRPKFAFFQRG